MGLKDWLAGNVLGPRSYGDVMSDGRCKAMKLKARSVTMADQDGNQVRAQLIVCPNPKCGSDLLRIVVVRGQTQLLCACCNESWCRLSNFHLVTDAT